MRKYFQKIENSDTKNEQLQSAVILQHFLFVLLIKCHTSQKYNILVQSKVNNLSTRFIDSCRVKQKLTFEIRTASLGKTANQNHKQNFNINSIFDFSCFGMLFNLNF